ncbi:MAG TPA: hypothetical protein DC009_04390 [Porphyromonadaceae bacterium]|nr:hypothetical protein [Porphyromonadaceae bacterium]
MSKFRLSINLLCVLIIAVTSFSVAFSLGEFTKGVVDGVDSVQSEDAASESADNQLVYFPTYLTPRDGLLTSRHDNIAAADSNGTVPVVMQQAIIAMPVGSIPLSYMICKVIIGLAVLVIFVLLIINFLKLTVRINRGNIFDNRNVKLLRRIGVQTLMIAGLTLVDLLLQSGLVDAHIPQLRDYSRTLLPALPWTNALIGLISLLMSKIWEGGLSMKKEQDLTI